MVEEVWQTLDSCRLGLEVFLLVARGLSSGRDASEMYISDLEQEQESVHSPPIVAIEAGLTPPPLGPLHCAVTRMRQAGARADLSPSP